MVTTSTAATWGGKTMDERRAARRSALIEAGLEAFAGEGYPVSSINRICKAAGVSERYLYEEFGGKEGLLIGVYNHLITETLAAVQLSLADESLSVEDQVRRSSDAFTHTLTADPRRARVNFLEVVGAGPAVEARRREVLAAFGDIICHQWQVAYNRGELSSPPDHGLAMALVGASQELLTDWMHTGQVRPRDAVVETLVRVYMAVMRA